MSDSTGLIAISFLAVFGFFLNMRILKMINDMGAQIVTGIVGGTSVSPGVRQGMLFQMWLPYELMGVSSSVFIALAQLELAASVSSGGTQMLAYLAAFIAGVGALAYSVTGASGLFQYRALIKRAAAR